MSVVKICCKHSTLCDAILMNKKHTYKKCKKLISRKLDLLCLCPVSTPDGKNQDIPMIDR